MKSRKLELAEKSNSIDLTLVTLQGVDAIRRLKWAVGIPVIAIGGIKPENAKAVFEAGADGVAVSSGLTTGDPAKNTAGLLAQSPSR